MKMKFRLDKIKIIKIWVQIYESVLSKINPYYILGEEHMG
jgi:hypothetical protein